MQHFLKYQNKKIGIFGLQRTGQAAYYALKNQAEVICFDENQIFVEDFAKEIGKQNIAHLNDARWQALDILIVSPGIPLDHPLVLQAKKNQTKITCDIEILYKENINSDFIAITGTNGKSTTTSLIHHIFNYAGLDYPMGGNIGISVLSLPMSKPGYILELSSFQLEMLEEFHANIGILLNITEDHLDRHYTMENYIAAKKRIFNNLQNSDFGIINFSDPICRKVYEEYKSFKPNLKLKAFSSECELANGIYVSENEIIDRIDDKKIIQLPKNIYLQGKHNRENIAASYIAARIKKIEIETILTAIQSFKGLPHRMEYIGGKDNIDYYNDSKATNIESAKQSLSSLENIFWLAGGNAKGANLSELPGIMQNVKQAYFFGQDALKLYRVLKNEVPCKLFETLQQAFKQAYQDAFSDQNNLKKNILLAPAAASTDQFRDFNHRGQYFTELVNMKLLSN